MGSIRGGVRRLAIGVLLTAGLSATVAPAFAQSRDLQLLSDAVRRLELQVSLLQRSVDQSRSAPPASLLNIDPDAPPSVAQLLIRVTEIEEALRSVTGRLEEMENELARQTSLVERFAADFDFRLRVLEDGQQSALRPGGDAADGAGDGAIAAAPPATPAPSPPATAGPAASTEQPPARVEPTSDGPPASAPAAPPPAPDTVVAGPSFVLPAGPPEEQYDYAYDFLLRGRYPDAQRAFQAFIIANPENPLAGNSQYWLGETYYARGQYDAAAQAFAQGFERYPDSDKVTHNLLKLGMSLAQLNQPENACDTLSLLLDDYPQAPASVRDRAAREHAAMAC